MYRLGWQLSASASPRSKQAPGRSKTPTAPRPLYQNPSRKKAHDRQHHRFRDRSARRGLPGADPAKFPLRATVDGLVDDWLTRHPREGYQLVVVHTHGHGDHVAGDAQFAGRLATTVVSRELDAVRQHFGFTGSPGHHRAAITVYDP
jgi:hypothetical protein